MPTEAQIRAEAGRILASPRFLRSARLGRFLRFAVEKTLAGRTEDLKESVLAIEVFDRRADYDPRIDSVVRVEARRLRSKLREYYENEGRGAELFIEIPEGSYVPRWSEARPGRKPPAAGVAVLPFANLSPDPGQEYFCDGVTEEIIAALSRAPGLNVVARTSSFQFREQPADAREIGARLGAGVIVEGSVRKAGGQVRISARIVDTSSGYQLASKTLDGSIEDVFAMQERVAAAVLEAMSGLLGLSVETAARPAPGGGGEYNLYLKGRFYWNRQTVEGFRLAAAQFREAIARNPAYAPAYAGLADCYCMLATYGGEPAAAAAEIIHQAAGEAIRLDPGLGEAYTTLAGTLSFYEWKWREGERHFRRAIELRPGYALAHHWYGMHLAALGRLDEAAEALAAAVRLDPLSADILTAAASVPYYRRDYELAAAELEEAFALAPDFPAAWHLLGRVRLAEGRFEEALECFEKAAPRYSAALALGWRGAVSGRWGKTEEARGALRALGGITPPVEDAPLAQALIHAGLGDSTRALGWLEAAAEGHAVLLSWLGADPFFDSLRGEARFGALLRRIGVAG